MESSFDILVVVLAVALGFFLLLGIVFMFFLVKVIRNVNTLTEKAHGIVNNVESASKIFEKSAGPVAVTKIIANVVDMFKDNQSSKSKRKGKK